MQDALGFLTIVGGPGRLTPKAVNWFPVVGLIIGSMLGGVWWVGAEVWTPVLAAALVVAADAIVTGGLHYDGLADAGDGLIPSVSKERRFEIMRSPDIGAFGIVSVLVIGLVRFAALASQVVEPLLLAGIWCCTRTAMAVVSSAMRPARQNGLAAAFHGASPIPALVVGTVFSTVATVAAIGYELGLLTLLAASLAFVGIVGFARRRIGGITGDVLGAAGIIAETVALVVAAA